VEATEGKDSQAEAVEHAGQLEDRLRALGYIE
jgi:hypothetical protein